MGNNPLMLTSTVILAFAIISVMPSEATAMCATDEDGNATCCGMFCTDEEMRGEPRPPRVETAITTSDEVFYAEPPSYQFVSITAADDDVEISALWAERFDALSDEMEKCFLFSNSARVLDASGLKAHLELESKDDEIVIKTLRFDERTANLLPANFDQCVGQTISSVSIPADNDAQGPESLILHFDFIKGE